MKDSQDKFFIGRQPILDRKQEIVGFELLFRSADVNFAEFQSYSHASASVITGALATFGMQEVLGGKLGFINVHLGLLLSEMLELLPVDRIVLELLEIIELDDEVVKRCRELKKLGFRLALDDHSYCPEYEEIYGIVDIVKIDILQTSLKELPEIVSKLRRWPVQILAEKVETVQQFEACFEMGFDLFQGYFFERPVVLNKRRIDASSIAMLKLLQQLTLEATLAEIEQTFKENPGLSYNLLHLVNSVFMGMREKIKTLRHAIVMLGTSHLRRWIQLSLFAGNDSRGINHPLLEMAAVRGRLLEILVMQKGFPVEYAEAAFMTGILSLLDVLFEMPMQELVESLNLTDEVGNALLRRKGPLGGLLDLVEKVEVTDFRAVTPLLVRCQVTLDQLVAAQLEAFSWRAKVLAGWTLAE
ncbi:cyclic diguanylate phosphodiesterase [Geobacter sp. SVR]|nr:cyclic diguanylate phosphodiesterase [Geobacter sp. SVR]GCF85755.1 cyclic diguanylate phosphodiesterase [Geobacter sp. SVR]